MISLQKTVQSFREHPTNPMHYSAAPRVKESLGIVYTLALLSSHLSCPLKLTRHVFMGWTTSNRRPPALKEFGSALVMAVSGCTGC